MLTSKRFSHTFQLPFPSTSESIQNYSASSINPISPKCDLNAEHRSSVRKSLKVTALWSMATGLDTQVDDDLAIAQKQLRELKVNISLQSKKNFILERDVRYLDSRIALLIRNRKALVVSELYPPEEVTTGIGQDFPDDRKLQFYGNLFFLLQTEVSYIANLTGMVNLSEIDLLLQTVMFTLYGNQYESREEHLLLSMFQMVLSTQFDTAVEFGSLLRANTPISRMLTTYTRRGPGQSYIKNVLSNPIKYLLEKNAFDVEINPVKILEKLQSKLNPTLLAKIESCSMSELLTVPEISDAVDLNCKKLLEIAGDFLKEIISSIKLVPYGIRWICKQIKSLTKRKFPEATDYNITSLIGGFFMLRFVNPAIVNPQSYMLLESKLLSSPKRTLTYIAKLLQNLANKPTQEKEGYMSKLHQEFTATYEQEFRDFLLQLCDVPDFHDQLEMDQYLALSKKDMKLTISLNEMYSIHMFISKYIDKLAPNAEDKLRKLLVDLGTPLQNVPRSENSVIELKLFSQWEIPILDIASTLMNDTFLTPNDILFMDTKCIMVQILRSLPEGMIHRPLQLMELAKMAAGHGKDHTLVSRGLKAQQMLKELKDAYDTASSNNFKLLVEEVESELLYLGSMHKEIQQEIISLGEVYRSICDHNEYLRSQLEAYRDYLKNVRAQASQSPLSTQPQHSKKIPCVSFSHQQLMEKGVICSSNIPVNRQGNTYFVIMMPLAGTYVFSMHYKGRFNPLLEMDLKLDDLLERQVDHVHSLDLEYLKLNVGRTLELLNKEIGRK